jgi:hypothetical protein
LCAFGHHISAAAFAAPQSFDELADWGGSPPFFGALPVLSVPLLPVPRGRCEIISRRRGIAAATAGHWRFAAGANNSLSPRTGQTSPSWNDDKTGNFASEKDAMQWIDAHAWLTTPGTRTTKANRLRRIRRHRQTATSNKQTIAPDISSLHAVTMAG